MPPPAKRRLPTKIARACTLQEMGPPYPLKPPPTPAPHSPGEPPMSGASCYDATLCILPLEIPACSLSYFQSKAHTGDRGRPCTSGCCCHSAHRRTTSRALAVVRREAAVRKPNSVTWEEHRPGTHKEARHAQALVEFGTHAVSARHGRGRCSTGRLSGTMLPTSAWCSPLVPGAIFCRRGALKGASPGARLRPMAHTWNKGTQASPTTHSLCTQTACLTCWPTNLPPRPGTRSGSQPCHVLKTVQPKNWLAAWQQGPHSQRPCRAGTARSTFWRVPDMLQNTHP